MKYSVFLEPIKEPEFESEGYFYAHVPALDLTTHGKGKDGALAAAKELVEVWITEKIAHGEKVRIETNSVVSQIEISDALLSS